jgi:hypothetical protein
MAFNSASDRSLFPVQQISWKMYCPLSVYEGGKGIVLRGRGETRFHVDLIVGRMAPQEKNVAVVSGLRISRLVLSNRDEKVYTPLRYLLTQTSIGLDRWIRQDIDELILDMLREYCNLHPPLHRNVW